MLGMCAPMRWRRWWWVLASSATCCGSRYLAGSPRPSWASWWLEWAGASAGTPCTGVAPGVRPPMPGWQDVLSRPMHYALYAFLIATPILGACCCVVASLFASGEHAGAGVAGAEVRLLRAGARGGLGVGEAGCPRMRGAVALQAETTEWGQKKPIRVESFRL